ISRDLYGPNPFPEAVQIAEYIRNNSAPDARIAVLGSEPEIPFYAGRHSASGHVYTYGMMEPQPYALVMQNEFIHDLEASRPEYVVFVGVSSSWLVRPNSPTRIFDWWRDSGSKQYKITGVADIVSADHTEYRWGGDAASYRPKSQYRVAVYSRIK